MKFNSLKKIAFAVLSAFGSTYLCEQLAWAVAAVDVAGNQTFVGDGGVQFPHLGGRKCHETRKTFSVYQLLHPMVAGNVLLNL
ncbi:hypothetical protein Y1Q_0007425 [Alligator mississippiensis]|uniref:Uncharacterized protein n=1 Tax=Alligator mississippiensis TaxID=8496 RepID=A0A151P7T0_ALLMI|nr:hypothetical protein Y1Q_0007425 [Alligator mississippiensis]